MITLPSEIATSAGMFVFAIVQALILLALAPLFSGISRMIREKCDYVVSLPMVGKIESLNASVSAGILMYEIFSKRNPM